MSCHHKYPEAASVVQQVYKVFNDIEILAGCTPAKVGESPKWNYILISAEKRSKFCKGLDGKPLFSTLYIMHTVTRKELKALRKVSEQAGQSGAVNKTSMESTAQDEDFR
jgi:hypothetical protein